MGGFRQLGLYLGMVILVLVGTLAINSLLALIANGKAVTQTLQVDHELDKVLFLVLDTDTSERAYLLTGSDTHLKRYSEMAGTRGLKGELQTLHDLTAQEPQQKHLLALESLIRIRITEMEATLQARGHGLVAARAIIRRHLTQSTAEKIRELVARIDEEENQRLTIQTVQRDQGAQRAVINVLVGTMLSIGLLLVSSTLLQRENAERKRSEATVRSLNSELEERVQQRTQHLEVAQQQIRSYAQDLELANVEMLERLAKAGEFRDDDTGRHTQRVGLTSSLIAEKLGFPTEQVRQIQQAARLHDLGKIGISDLILLKPGVLTQDEFAVMKTHTLIGAELFADGHSDLIRTAQLIAVSHHERWDGRGYPHHLCGEDIPLVGRIVAVADVFDALTHERPYKQAWPVEKAIEEIRNGSGKQFDPRIVEAFLTLPHIELL